MTSDNLYILAGNYEEARDFAYRHGHHYSRMVSVDRIDKIRGLRGLKLYVTSSAKYRKDYEELLLEAKIREFVIEHV